jgi:hypothetical protein
MNVACLCSKDDNPLETRSMRERVQSTRTVNYEHLAIRFVINSTFILQGLFYSNEPISHLVDFIRANVRCSHVQHVDFYLYTSPPRLILSDLTKSLLAYDLAPAAYVYLGHRKVSPLTVELASTIRIGTIDEANRLVTEFVFNRSRPMAADQVELSSSERPMSTTTTTSNSSSSVKRNTSTILADDEQLKDKLRKFLPGKK